MAAREAGLTAADIDVVAYNFAGHRYLAGLAGTPGHLLQPATRPRALPRAASFAVIHHRYRQRMSNLRGLFPNARVRGVPHHMAHGLYAFAASGFTEAAVLIIDSLGETCTTSIGSGQSAPDGGRPVPDQRVDQRPGVPRLRLRRRHHAPGLAAR